MKYWLVLWVLFCSIFMRAQLQYEQVFDENIQAVSLKGSTDIPLVALGQTNTLLLSFDDLAGGFSQYTYTLVQYRSDWTPVSQQAFDYLSGFTEGDIRQYNFSYNTYQDYTHYQLSFPENNMQPSQSGNYCIWVYKNFDKNQPILCKRFVVVENIFPIQPKGFVDNFGAIIDQQQRIEFLVKYRPDIIFNPLTDLTVSIFQNGRWDNSISEVQPRTYFGNELEFSIVDRNMFDNNAGFRYFDSRTLSAPARVYEINEQTEPKQIWLDTDYPQGKENYPYRMNSLKGAFYDGWVFSNDARFDTDYFQVHFSLRTDTTFADAGVYLWGEFTQWKAEQENELTYNERKGTYEATLYLKQGLYSYQYMVCDEENNCSAQVFEASPRNVANSYTILLYHRDFNAVNDRVVGYFIVEAL
ncbi:MAG: DUF5103 domain-containing protein [Chitinophagales bacterium]|nr:DUF5103 domain-containing protein [Bacteroidota bacterium]MCB9043673.1 DUF5103 domain-containing protein [Chitinophagales bacterium]